MEIKRFYKDRSDFEALCNSNLLLVAKSKFTKKDFSFFVDESQNIEIAEKYLALTVIHNIAKNLAKQRVLNYKNFDPFNKSTAAVKIISHLDNIFQYKQKLQINEYLYSFFNIIPLFFDITPPVSSKFYDQYIIKQNYIISLLCSYFPKETKKANLTPKSH